MKYIDLHCDALTKEGIVSVTSDNLKRGECLAQCFAAFVNGERGEGRARTFELCDKFEDLRAREGYSKNIEEGKIAAFLTVEGGEGIGSLRDVETLRARGVRMIGLTWNVPNALGGFHGENRGLTPFGRECVARMAEIGVLPDVAHGSDELLICVAEICREKHVPFVASHAGARAVFSHSRNLSDEGIRNIAESGGVVGLYFVAKFLSEDESEEGQREAVIAHLRHLWKTGGEDLLAIGSDFDGAPPNAYLPTPAAMPRFLEKVSEVFTPRLAEKFSYRNALRLLLP